MHLEALTDFACRLVDATGPIARRWFRSPLEVETKSDLSPVTRADRDAETAMRDLIGAAYPEHGIVGEEHGSERAEAEFVWVLDPIDGTKAFVTGKPLFGTLVALLHRGRPVVGIVDAPALGERWVGAEGRPTLFNGRPAATRGCDLSRAIVNSTTPEMFEGADAAAVARLRGGVAAWHYGGDCYAYGLLASGFFALVIEAKMKPFDHLPLVPVVTGAGGTITDWAGRPLGLDSDGRVLAAADASLHAAARGLLAG
ncbi:MAG: inositol monophosphatase family protein [Alphaproteobacteria bacterium]